MGAIARSITASNPGSKTIAQVEAVALPSGLLVLAAEMPAVLSVIHPHRVHDHGVGHRVLRLADRVHVRPGPQPVEAVTTQHLLLVGGPGGGRSEFLFEGLFLAVRAAVVKTATALWIKGQPSGSTSHQRSPIFCVRKNPVASCRSTVQPPYWLSFGSPFRQLETRKAVDGLRLVALPFGFLRILPGLDLPVLRSLGREASGGQHGGRQERQSVQESFHTAIRSYRGSRPATRSRRRARGCGTSAYRWHGRSAHPSRTCT